MKSTDSPAIYEIYCTSNKKRYIGSAVNPYQRYHSHVSSLCKGDHYNKHLQRAWDKYGEGAFLFNIIERVEDEKRLIEREQHWMDFYKTYNREVGFNLSPTAGSPLGVVRTQEYCQKMSTVKKNPSKETRKNLSDSKKGVNNPNYGKRHTEEVRKKMSISSKGDKHPFYGKHLSEEHRNNISKANSQLWEVTNPDGESTIIRNLVEFCRKQGLSGSNMCIVAQGKQKTHKGWKCKKIKEEGEN